MARQRDYYRATAATYPERHVGEQNVKALAQACPVARVEGIEPVAELRQQAQRLQIRDWRHAVAEMARGVGNALIWLQTEERMSKYSEGDGVFYSVCLAL